MNKFVALLPSYLSLEKKQRNVKAIGLYFLIWIAISQHDVPFHYLEMAIVDSAF